jgi:hypothetical protein
MEMPNGPVIDMAVDGVSAAIFIPGICRALSGCCASTDGPSQTGKVAALATQMESLRSVIKILFVNIIIPSESPDAVAFDPAERDEPITAGRNGRSADHEQRVVWGLRPGRWRIRARDA